MAKRVRWLLVVAASTAVVVAGCNTSGGSGAPAAALQSNAPKPTVAAAAGGAAAPASGAAAGATCAPDKAATTYPGLAGKTLQIGLDPTNAPYEFRSKDDPNTIVGFDPDMIAAAMQCLGLKYEFKALEFAGLIPALQASQVDLVWSSLLYTPERAKVVDFVVYQKAGTGALVKKGNPLAIHALDDVCGKRASAVLGTVEEAAFRDQSPKCQAAGKAPIDITTYPNAPAASRAVENDRADVYMTDLVLIDQIVQDNPTLYERGYKIVSGFQFGVAVPKGKDELLNAVYQALQVLQANGTEKQLLDKHGMDTELLQTASIQKQ